MNQYGPVNLCQSCGSEQLSKVFYLGYLPPVNTMRKIGAAADQEPWFPAELFMCERCKLVQLGYVADPRTLFPPDYPYTSGTTKALLENFADLANQSEARLGIGESDLVVDIGSNDGSLLDAFRQRGGYRVIGIEPTNASSIAIDKGIETYKDFFSIEVVEQLVRDHGRARVVTATNVFAHIHSVSSVLEAIAGLVEDDGYFVTESHYLGSIVDGLQYDTIYHEHIRYYSLHSLKYLLETHGFTVIAVETIATHGGSIRVYAAKSQAAQVDDSVNELLAKEIERGLQGMESFRSFAARVAESRSRLLSILYDIKRVGANIVGIGAPSRSSTLANYVGLDSGCLDCIYEISGSAKIGKYLPGTDIPILDEALLYEKQPAYALMLSWHIGLPLCRALRRRGYKGDFIMPLPVPTVIKGDTL